jgi:hypothetical protein
MVDDQNTELWLEVDAIREHLEANTSSTKPSTGPPAPDKTVHVQVKGDKADRKVWWPLDDGLVNPDRRIYQDILDAIDKKRTILGRLHFKNGHFVVTAIRIQSLDSATR